MATEPRQVVAECWSCGGYHTDADETAKRRRPMPLSSLRETEAHYANGHDVRPVAREDEK